MPDNQSISLRIASGEGQRIEFKERPVKAAKLERELVAFANASGGSIFLGVNDRGEVVGIADSNRLRSQIHDIARNCDPPVSIALERHSEGVLEIRVEEGANKPYRCKDGFFLRVGPNAQKLNRDEIARLILDQGAFRFDETPNKDFNFPRDFDEDRLGRFCDMAGITLKAAPEDLLCSLDVAKRTSLGLQLTQAGVLFFARRPQRHIKESHLTCVRYQGTDRFEIIDREDIYGNPITMVEQALAFVRRNISKKYIISTTAQRQERYLYPLPAVREAIINAVMHRDYFYDASHIYLHIFADRFEVENPGGLYPGLRIEDLGKRSVRRNRAIADLLYRVRFVEQVGSGIPRMRSTLEANGNPPMEISATNFFVVRFFPRIVDEESISLTSRQNQLFRYIESKGSIAKSDAARMLGVSGDTALREIKVLVQAGLVLRKGQGKKTTYSCGP